MVFFLLPMSEVCLRMRPNMALTKDEADHALEIMSNVIDKNLVLKIYK